MDDQGFYTYILECADGTYYTGWTTHVQKRVDVHNSGKGAKYTKNRLPVKVLATWAFQNKSEAMKFEAWVKKLPRQEKVKLVSSYS